VIHHGIQLEKFEFVDTPEDYMVWLGRLTAKKGIKEAIEVAKITKKKLIIAGIINTRDHEFYDQEILPEIDNKLIFKLGGLGLKDKVDLLKKAKVLLYPVTWEEPFGLVMIEALATGTPVIGTAHGAVTEILEDGQTGYLVKDDENKIETMAEKVGQIFNMEQPAYKNMRQASRKKVEENFTVEKMVDKYEQVYLKMLNSKQA
jgi:glycosyltransferase involved in cell wall biosynthesis